MSDDESGRPEKPVVHDVADTSRPLDEPTSFPLGLILLVIGISALIVFIAQNDHDAEVRFLGFEGSFSVSVLILTSALLGAVITMLGAVVMRRRRRKAQRAARAAKPPSAPGK